jgi:hypothetical protein
VSDDSSDGSSYDAGYEYDSGADYDDPDGGAIPGVPPIPGTMFPSLIQQPGQVAIVVITPNTPAEILVPLQLDGANQVAFTTDPVQRALQHILSIAMTSPGERVMRPTYGVGLQRLTFENMDGVNLSLLLNTLQTAYNNSDDGGFTVTNVSAVPSAQSPTTLQVSISYQLDQDNTIHEAVFDSSGNYVGST